MLKGQLDHREDWMEVAEVEEESKVVCTMADTGFDDKEPKCR
jgi:hypothetical protein